MEEMRRYGRAVVGLVVVGLVVTAAASAIEHDGVSLEPGTVASPANGTTVVSVQGFHFEGQGNVKKPARLVGVDADGEVEWRHGGGFGSQWFYDVDPLPGGSVLVTSTVPGDTVVYEYDPDNETRVWTERFDAEDTHDVELHDGDLYVANMRARNESSDASDDRIFVYDRDADEVVWEWYFRDHYPADGGGGSGDWTHVNDVDVVDDETILASPRNFDQVILIDRETKEITLRLGADDRHEILHAQHNPDYLRGPEGRPTFLVADSENDRVVEYVRTNGTWERTWTVTGFNWPRDADRLPNGNTLVTDSLNHRVVEISPDGRVVWEFYAPWAPYDAERVRTGGGSSGPTMQELDAGGRVAVHGGAGEGPAGAYTVGEFLTSSTRGVLGEDLARTLGARWSHVTPFVRPVWLPDWSFAFLVAALLVALPWATVEVVWWRRRRSARSKGRGRPASGDADG